MKLKKILIILLFALIMSIGIFGYMGMSWIEYQSLKKETQAIIIPISFIEGDTIIPLYKSRDYKPFTSLEEFSSKYNIGITPDIQTKVMIFDMTNAIKTTLTKDYFEKYKKEHPDYAKAIESAPQDIIFDFDKKFGIESDSRVVLRVESPYSIGQKYTLSLNRKTNNIWSYLLGAPSQTETNLAKADITGRPNNPIDAEIERYIISVFRSYFTRDLVEQEEQKKENCKYIIGLDKNATNIYSRKPTIEFNYLKGRCASIHADEDTPSSGEAIWVNIFTSNLEDGKKAFQAALAQDGFKESDKLRVNYVYMPKTKDELIKYYEAEKEKQKNYSPQVVDQIEKILQELKSQP